MPTRKSPRLPGSRDKKPGLPESVDGQKIPASDWPVVKAITEVQKELNPELQVDRPDLTVERTEPLPSLPKKPLPDKP